MTLRSLAQELTQPHLKMVSGRIGKVPGLIPELREAVKHSSANPTGGGSKQKAPLDTAALSLLDSIQRDMRSAFSDRYGQSAPMLEICVALIGQDEHNTEWETYFTAQLAEIKTSIEAHLRPRKTRKLSGIQCPSCERSKYGEDNLTCLELDCYISEHKELKPMREWEVRCRGCDATWAGDNMRWLIVALAE